MVAGSLNLADQRFLTIMSVTQTIFLSMTFYYETWSNSLLGKKHVSTWTSMYTLIENVV